MCVGARYSPRLADIILHLIAELFPKFNKGTLRQLKEGRVRPVCVCAFPVFIARMYIAVRNTQRYIVV